MVETPTGAKLKRSLQFGFVVSVVLLAADTGAQTTATTVQRQQSGGATDRWTFTAAITGYLAPDDQNYGTPEFAADRKRMHLEARYNYEDLRTGSLWAGYSFTVGHRVELDVTPMVGAVFGRTNGLAPGYEMALTYKNMELSSEGELLIDIKNSQNDFFYSWNELVYSPTEWFHAGLVSQTTQAYQTTLDIQRGLSAGFAHHHLDFTTYVFNLGWTDPTVVLELDYRFHLRGGNKAAAEER
jgi:hypothetical protein